MDALTLLKQLLFPPQKLNSYGWLREPPRGTAPRDGEASGQVYVRVRMTDMRLKVGARLGVQQEPVLQSLVSVDVGEKRVSVAKTVGPDAFATLAPKSQFRRLSQDGIFLTDWLPYNGGTIELVIGLLSVPNSDGLVQAAGVMNDLSELVLVPAISTVADVAGKLAQGVETLFGTQKTRALLGAQVELDGAELQPRYYLSVGDDNPQNEVASYRFDEGTRVLSRNSSPVSDLDYFIVELELRTTIGADWDRLPSIRQPFVGAQDALINGKPDKARALLDTAWVAAFQSPDLIRADRPRVTKSVVDAWAVFVNSRPDLGNLPPAAPASTLGGSADQLQAELESRLG